MTDSNRSVSSSSPPRPLPADPDWDQYRKQAKDLLRCCRAADGAAISRVRNHHPRYRSSTPEQIGQASLRLADAQLAIARERGFPSWARFKVYVARLASGEIRPVVQGYYWYADQAGRAVSQLRAGGAAAVERARRWHPALASVPQDELAALPLGVEDGRTIIAREHGFDDWNAFMRHMEAVGEGVHEFETPEPGGASPEAERTAEVIRAVQQGRVDDLRGLLDESPGLVEAQAAEGHGLLLLATQERNAPMVALLLERGADPNHGLDGWTALHQAAYGEPPDPSDAGQQSSLAVMELLLDAGARIDVEARGSGGTPLLQSLFWGIRPLAERLAREGVVPDNLRTAAGLGRLDAIERFFEADGRLREQAGVDRGYAAPHEGFPASSPSDDPAEILADALVYAAVNGRLEAVDLLLDRGADPNAAPYQETALFGAVRRGNAPVVLRLLERGADVNARADWASMTKLTALHHAASVARLDMAKLLVEAGADLEARDEVASGTPASWAAHFENADIQRYLEETGISSP